MKVWGKKDALAGRTQPFPDFRSKKACLEEVPVVPVRLSLFVACFTCSILQPRKGGLDGKKKVIKSPYEEF